MPSVTPQTKSLTLFSAEEQETVSFARRHRFKMCFFMNLQTCQKVLHRRLGPGRFSSAEVTFIVKKRKKIKWELLAFGNVVDESLVDSGF